MIDGDLDFLNEFQRGDPTISPTDLDDEGSYLPSLTTETGRGRCSSMFVPTRGSTSCPTPEFLQEGTGVHDSLEPDQLLVGADDAEGFDAMRRLYAPPVRHEKVAEIPAPTHINGTGRLQTIRRDQDPVTTT